MRLYKSMRKNKKYQSKNHSKKKLNGMAKKIWICDLLSESAYIQIIHAMIMSSFIGVQLLEKLPQYEQHEHITMIPYIYIPAYLVSTIVVILYRSLTRMRRIACVKNITTFETIYILLCKLPLLTNFLLEIVVYVSLFLIGGPTIIGIYYMIKLVLLKCGISIIKKDLEVSMDRYKDVLQDEINIITGKEVIVK